MFRQSHEVYSTQVFSAHMVERGTISKLWSERELGEYQGQNPEFVKVKRTFERNLSSLAKQTIKLWDGLPPNHKKQLNKHKGEIISLVALNVLKQRPNTQASDTKAVKIELKRVIERELQDKHRRQLDTNPRHEIARGLSARVKYYAFVSKLHLNEELSDFENLLYELIEIKSDLLKFDKQPKIIGKLHLTKPSDQLTLAELNGQTEDAWCEMCHRAKQIEKQLIIEDPSSAHLMEIYRQLDEAYNQAHALESLLTAAERKHYIRISRAWEPSRPAKILDKLVSFLGL